VQTTPITDYLWIRELIGLEIIMKVKAICIVSFFVTGACSESQFNSGKSERTNKSSVSSNQEAPEESPASVESTLPTPQEEEASEESPAPVESTLPTPREDVSTCWVAVSGAYFGCPRKIGDEIDLASPYPFRNNLKPSLVSEVDAVLDIRPKEYRYHGGEPEIDVVFANSLDTLLVTPGVTIDLTWEDGTKKSITGPALILNSEGAFGVDIRPGMQKAIRFYQSQPDQMPTWLRDLLKLPSPITAVDLSEAQAIQVSSSEGASCK
jgi:hypothetical protein